MITRNIKHSIMAAKCTMAKNNEPSAKEINRLVYESGFFCHDCGKKWGIFPTYWNGAQTLDEFLCEYGMDSNERKCHKFRCPACARKYPGEPFYCDEHLQP